MYVYVKPTLLYIFSFFLFCDCYVFISYNFFSIFNLRATRVCIASTC